MHKLMSLTAEREFMLEFLVVQKVLGIPVHPGQYEALLNCSKEIHTVSVQEQFQPELAKEIVDEVLQLISATGYQAVWNEASGTYSVKG